MLGGVYIRVPADLLDGGLIKVTGVAQEASTDRVGVLQTIKDLAGEGRLATLPQLKLTGLLVGRVDVVEPDMVLRSVLVGDVLLELDDVAVGDGLCVGRGQERCSISVDSLCAERGDDSRGDAGREGESSEALHYDVVLLMTKTDDKERRESASDRIENGFQKEEKTTRAEGDARSMMVRYG